MKYKEVRCKNCLCKVKDARDIIEVDIIPGCSSPRYREFTILGQNNRIGSIQSGQGCCHDRLFVVYKPVSFTVRRGFGTSKNNRLYETVEKDTSTPQRFILTDDAFTSGLRENVVSDPSNYGDYNFTSTTNQYHGNMKSSPSSTNQYNGKIKTAQAIFNSQAYTSGSILFGAGFLLVFLGIIVAFLIRTKRKSSSHTETQNSIQNAADTEYSTIAEVTERREDVPNTSTLVLSTQKPTEDAYYVLEKEETREIGIQCNSNDLPNILHVDLSQNVDEAHFTLIELNTCTEPPTFLRQQSEPVRAVCSFCLHPLSHAEGDSRVVRSMSLQMERIASLHTLTYPVQNCALPFSIAENPYDIAEESDGTYAHLKRSTKHYENEYK